MLSSSSDVTPEELAERHAAVQDARAAELAELVRRFVQPAGDERALDVGTGVGALALALAPLVREVVAVDVSRERLELARQRAPANVSFVEADTRRLPFEPGAFDLAGTMRTLHHIERPEYVVAELARVTRPGGRLLVIDQLAPVDPLVAIELDRFERARDPTHARLLPDIDLRHLFEANGLVVLRAHVRVETREMESYLDLAGCEGDARERARGLAPRAADRAEIGWYLLRKPGGPA